MGPSPDAVKRYEEIYELSPEEIFGQEMQEKYPVHQFEDPNVKLSIAQLSAKYQLNYLLASRLSNLQGYQIVLLLDDSGSMNAETDTYNRYNGQKNTRWTELIEYVDTTIEIGTAFDPDGIDVYFLNRAQEGIKNVKSYASIGNMFHDKPTRYHLTPLKTKVNQILSEYQQRMQNGEKVLLLIATDGQPSDCYMQNWDSRTARYGIDEFRDTLMRRVHYTGSYEKNPIVIRACTSDSMCVGYMNVYDKEIPKLDVVDDFASERTEILNMQGSNFNFQFADYIVKSLLGGIDDWFDKLDELPLSAGQHYFAQHGKVNPELQEVAPSPYGYSVGYPAQPYRQQPPKKGFLSKLKKYF